MQSRTKSILWDPKESNRFLIAGGSEVRCYELESSKTGPPVMKTLSVCSDITQMRTFAWSGDAFVAVGLATGRTLLTRLDGLWSAMISQPSGAVQNNTASPVLQINVRHSRPTNVLAFCPTDTRHLAIGLDKARGESLLIYDIEAASRSLSQPGGGATFSPPLRNSSPASGSSSEPRPIAQYGSSEAVTSLAFLYAQSGGPVASGTHPPLVAAMGGKFLRTYDVRSPASSQGVGAMPQWATRSLHGITANPFNGFQFASFGDDGIVRIWDLRKPFHDAILTFSEIDSGSYSLPSTKGKSTVTSNASGGQSSVSPLSEIKWSTKRRGILTSLEKEGRSLTAWHMVEGPPSLLTTGTGSDGSAVNIEMRFPILLEDQRTKRFAQPLSSFAYLPQPDNSSDLAFVGLTREHSTFSPHSAASGLTGQAGINQVEVVKLSKPPHIGFMSERKLAVVAPRGSAAVPNGDCKVYELEDVPSVEMDRQDADDLDDDEVTPGHLRELTLDSDISRRGRPVFTLLSVQGRTRNANRSLFDNEPEGSLTPRRLSRQRASAQLRPPSSQGSSKSGMAELARDPSLVLKDRVAKGYGAQATTNARMVDAPLREFWTWIARADGLASGAIQDGFDFRFRGVAELISGFNKSKPSSKSANTGSNSSYSDLVSKSIKQTGEISAKEKAYSNAANSLASRRGLLNPRKRPTSFQSKLVAQRALALQIVDPLWQEDFDTVQATFIHKHDYAGAAKYAFFCGRFENASQNLSKCEDEKFRLVAPALAAHIMQGGSDSQKEGFFSQFCRTLSSDADVPWVRAIFAYLATGDWRDFLDESALPLQDRLGVALRFLPDAKLQKFLSELGRSLLSSSNPDLEAISFFGLRAQGIELISKFVTRTSDVQTAALAMGYVYPSILPRNLRAARWVETYRSLLDTMELYTARALFDHAMGKRTRAAIASREVPAYVTAAVEQKRKEASRPQLLLRCQFCSTEIKPAPRLPSGELAVAATKASLCPACLKSLPGCAICLMKPHLLYGQPSSSSSSLAICSICRHGGHLNELAEWFSAHSVCAVSGCGCSCDGR